MSAPVWMNLDPEALIIRVGVLALAALSVIRLVWSDFKRMRADFRRKRRRQTGKGLSDSTPRAGSL